MKLKGKEMLDLLIEGTYLLVVFLIPVSFAFWFPTYNIFELHKIVIFKVLVNFFLLFTVIKIVLYFPFAPFNRWKASKFISMGKRYWLIPLLLILGLTFSLIFSSDIDKSFYGSYARQEGLLSYVFYFLWFILLSFNIISISNGRREDPLLHRVNRVVTTAVLSSFVVAIYGILQIFNIDFLTWPEAPYLTQRTLSSFGQPNFLASFLLLTTPLSLYLWHEKRQFMWRFLYILIFVSQMLCLFFTASRGAFVAILLTSLLFLVHLWYKTTLSRSRRIALGSVVIITIVMAVSSLQLIIPGRLNSLVDYKVGSVAARVNFYQAAANAITKNPVFGYGLEAGNDIFIKYYDVNWAINGDVAATTDRAHNLVLDILLSSGFWGLILFTLFYYAFFHLAWRNISQRKNKNLSLAIMFGAGAYLLSLLFSFSVVATEIYFWLFFALLISFNFSDFKNSAQKIGGMKNVKLIVCFFILMLSLWGVCSSLKILMADHYFNKLYYTFAQGDYYTTFVLDDYVRESRLSNTQQNFYNRFLGDKLSDVYPTIMELSTKSLATEKLNTILKELPDHGYENLLVKAKVYAALDDFDRSEDYFALLNAQSSHWPRGYFELAKMLTRKGDFVPAVAAYHLVELNLPDPMDVRVNDRHRQSILYYRYVIYRDLGDLYQKNEEYANAGKYYQLAYRNNPQDFTLLKKVADAYYLSGDIGGAIEYNRRGYARNPSDYNWPLALSILYHQEGEKDQALAFINEAIALNPDSDYLQALKNDYGN